MCFYMNSDINVWLSIYIREEYSIWQLMYHVDGISNQLAINQKTGISRLALSSP